MNMLLFNIWSVAKNYILYILGVVALCGIFFCRCGNPSPKNIITNPVVVSQKVLAEIKKEIPDAVKAQTFIPIKANLGEKVTETIVQKKDGSIVVLQKQVAAIGFKHDLGIWIGGLTQLDGGLSLDLLQIQRFNGGLLAGVKSAGIQINYMVYNNTSLGAGYTYSYIGIPGPVVFVKLNF